MRARRSSVRVVGAVGLVAVSGEDGLELGTDQPIIIFIVVFFATLEVFILLAVRTRGLSMGGLGAGSRNGGRLGGRLAGLARTYGVAHVEIFKDVHVTRRPNDPLVESGPPLAGPARASAFKSLRSTVSFMCLTRSYRVPGPLGLQGFCIHGTRLPLGVPPQRMQKSVWSHRLR